MLQAMIAPPLSTQRLLRWLDGLETKMSKHKSLGEGAGPARDEGPYIYLYICIYSHIILVYGRRHRDAYGAGVLVNFMQPVCSQIAPNRMRFVK